MIGKSKKSVVRLIIMSNRKVQARERNANTILIVLLLMFISIC